MPCQAAHTPRSSCVCHHVPLCGLEGMTVVLAQVASLSHPPTIHLDLLTYQVEDNGLPGSWEPRLPSQPSPHPSFLPSPLPSRLWRTSPALLSLTLPAWPARCVIFLFTRSILLISSSLLLKIFPSHPFSRACFDPH